ncbi:hypothetical protein QN354_02170 [Cryobacterium sp. 5I3]|uniref:hypothetical protein n=1 Tax=Cryobacterium sp. 5I3 TaxID=3048592 RepID=UPI002B22AA43|nr:hypothetical protein [Cryobacterium sp. 5I3]MEB0200560.1 hypothetical protein [Cryobacterium sp. 5I3]
MKRILTIGHVWPGITPLNVGDLEHRVWVQLALSCDQHIKEVERHNAAVDSRNRGT